MECAFNGDKFKGHGSNSWHVAYNLIYFVVLRFFSQSEMKVRKKGCASNWSLSWGPDIDLSKEGNFDSDDFFSLLITGKNRVRRRRVAKDPRVRSIGLCDEDQRAAAQYAVWMDGATGESHFLIFLNLPLAHFEATTLLLTRVSADKLKVH